MEVGLIKKNGETWTRFKVKTKIFRSRNNETIGTALQRGKENEREDNQ